MIINNIVLNGIRPYGQSSIRFKLVGKDGHRTLLGHMADAGDRPLAAMADIVVEAAQGTLPAMSRTSAQTVSVVDSGAEADNTRQVSQQLELP